METILANETAAGSRANTAEKDLTANPGYQAYQILRTGFTVAPIIAGVDKFLGLLVNWDQYLSPIAVNVLGESSHGFMLLVGVVEMIVGLMVISRWPRQRRRPRPREASGWA